MVCSPILVSLFKNPAVVLLSIWAAFPTVVIALPIPDSTLGTQNNPLAPGAVEIDGGITVGQNLFHSFESFNIDIGEAVFFISPADINHIFSRVTGNGASNINGVLGTQGSDADLFLMNPNGVIFGPEASLDVQGSFIVTTADAIEFAEAGSFGLDESVADLGVLTVDPSAFLFSPGNTGAIINRSRFTAGSAPNGAFNVAGLRVPDNRNISLIGGTIISDGGGLIAFGGNVELISIAETLASEQQIDFQATETVLIPDNTRGDITLTNDSDISTIASDGGRISLYANNINIIEGSTLLTGIPSNLGSSESQSGNIILDASNTLNIIGNDVSDSLILNLIGVNSLGNSGNVILRAQDLNISKRGSAGVLNFGSNGNTGDVIVNVPGQVEIDGQQSDSFTGIFAILSNLSSGSSGNINIKTQDLAITNGAEIEASNFGAGNSGNIDIEAQYLSIGGGARIDASIFGQGQSGNVSVDVSDIEITGRGLFFSPNETGVSLNVFQGSTGNAGDLIITTDKLALRNRGSLIANNFGQGNAGRIEINASEQLLLDGEQGGGFIRNNLDFSATGSVGGIGIQATSLVIRNGYRIESQLQGVGNSNGIVIEAQELALQNGSRIDGSILGGAGNAGDIKIVAENIEINETSSTSNSIFSSGIFLNNNNRSEAASGNIIVNTNNLTLGDNGELSARHLSGRGSVGQIQIIASDQILLNGLEGNSRIRNNIESGAEGSAAGILIETGSLIIQDGSSITSRIEDSGSRGTTGPITIRAQDRVVLSGNDNLSNGRFNPSSISSGLERGSEGEVGGIIISTNSLRLADGAQLSSTTEGLGDAGNIQINAAEDVHLSDSLIISEVTRASEVEATNSGNAGNAGNAGSAGGSNTESSSNLGISNNVSTTTVSEINNVSEGLNTSESRLLGGIGDGGDIVITANRLELIEGAALLADTENQGNAGNLRLDIRDTLIVSGEGAGGIFRESIVPSQITTTVDGEGATGTGGDINIRAGNIVLADGGFISSGTAGVGDAGAIDITARELQLTDRTEISSRSTAERTNISSTSANAGDITIEIADSLRLTDSDISTESINFAGGDIRIIANTMQLRGDGDITTNVQQGPEGGGDITLTADSIIALDDSDIISSAPGGKGGNITLDTPAFFGQNLQINAPGETDLNERVDLNATGAIDGEITTPDVSFVQNNLTPLPDALINTETLIVNSCVAPTQDGNGTFLVAGVDGLPNQPGNGSISVYPTTREIQAEHNTEASVANAGEAQAWQPGQPIVEPQDVYQLADGRLIISHTCK